MYAGIRNGDGTPINRASPENYTSVAVNKTVLSSMKFKYNCTASALTESLPFKLTTELVFLFPVCTHSLYYVTKPTLRRDSYSVQTMHSLLQRSVGSLLWLLSCFSICCRSFCSPRVAPSYILAHCSVTRAAECYLRASLFVVTASPNSFTRSAALASPTSCAIPRTVYTCRVPHIHAFLLHVYI